MVMGNQTGSQTFQMCSLSRDFTTHVIFIIHAESIISHPTVDYHLQNSSDYTSVNLQYEYHCASAA